MFNLIIYSTKVLLVGLWLMVILGLVSLSPLPAQYQFYALALASVVLLVHLVEYFVMKAKVLSKTKTQMSFIQTMLWGFGYWLPLINTKP
ncbi:MAG: DUF1145 domain-containing protein [Colwellia sp.]|nr:DUF1145 domain-containing protein [Colwellia sp.]MCW9083037.1 DUF1145 domain-containing protein [Colwellia sp.]